MTWMTKVVGHVFNVPGRLQNRHVGNVPHVPFRRLSYTSVMKAVAGMRYVVLLLVSGATGQDLLAEDGKLPLEISVKQLQAPAPSAPDMQMVATRRPIPSPTTPGAKYPQYQLGHQQRKPPQPDQVTNPHVRFFLILPQGPLLIDATITIDGLPFQMVRERRIGQILKEAATTREPDVAIPLAADAASTGDTGTADGTGTVATAAQVASNIPDRLRHTMKVTGEIPTAEEVDWILSNWVDGPTTLQLNDNFQRFRANQRPEFVIIDRNRDGTISAEELPLAVQSFQECDLNRDEIIQFTEIAQAAADPRAPMSTRSTLVTLITLLPDHETAATVYQRLVPMMPHSKEANSKETPTAAPRFDINGNGQFDAEELQAILQAPPDLTLKIAFDSTNPQESPALRSRPWQTNSPRPFVRQPSMSCALCSTCEERRSDLRRCRCNRATRSPSAPWLMATRCCRRWIRMMTVG